MTAETKRVAVVWEGGMRFRGGEAGGPTSLVDADNVEAPGPTLTLLLAAAACSGADVVTILEKMRVGLDSLRIDVAGVRRESVPRRFVSIRFAFHVRGTGLDEAKARRAIDLSLEKYCSVVHSLAPDIAVEYDLHLA
ncbi:MAG TPA: OsmC family protein [Gemmatimonadales bacterium]